MNSTDVSRTYVYSHSQTGFLRSALRMLGELREDEYDTVILVRSSPVHTPDLALAILFSTLLRARHRLLLDDSFQAHPLTHRSAISCALDIALFALGLPLARIGTALALFLTRRISPRISARHTPQRDLTAFLVPILPDISHTFIYREILQILAEFGREKPSMVVALEHGSHIPMHNEAKGLLSHAVFVPPCSLRRYLGLYLYYLASRPLRMARLIECYAPHSNRDPFLFLRLNSFHGLHPSRGIALTRLLEKEGVARIHCYGMSYPATRALVASKLLHIPLSISTFVDFDYEYAYKCLNEKVHHATFLVACTYFCKNRLAELTDQKYGGKIHVIHHALDSRFRTHAVDSQKDCAKDVPNIFTACRFVEKKGIEYLIQAVALLKQRRVITRCIVIGDGERRESFARLVQELGLDDYVCFVGALPNHRIWHTVGPEDICVVPSVYCADGERDGIPVILLEALLKGHAVVSTHVSGIPELITDGIHGLLVPERDSESLADAIEKLLRDAHLRRKLAFAGCERVSTDFDIRNKANQLWTLLEPECHEADRVKCKRVMGGQSLTEGQAANWVSLIMVNHNGRRFIKPLFDSLLRQTRKPEEVWFFDNGSTDGSADFVMSHYARVNVVREEGNRGYSIPVNEGIRRSKGEYILVMNVDLVLEDTFIEEMVKVLERNPTVGWAAGKLLKLTESGKSDTIDCLGHHMSRCRYATETDYSRPFAWADYDEERFVFGASACAALYRRAMLDDVKVNGEYFDEDFFAYFEDVDLDWRAQQRGWKCIYTPKALGHHMRGGSGLFRERDIAACYLGNRWLMLLKNDRGSHLLQDFAPFVCRLARDIYTNSRTDLWIPVQALGRLVKYSPKMLRKRRRISATRVVPISYLRGLIRG